MKKSVKILFTALLVGLAVVMTSCGAMASVLSEAWCLDGKKYTTSISGTTVSLEFKMETGDYGNNKLVVTIGDKTDSGYNWMLDPGEAVAEVKNIWIYKGGTSISDRIGLLEPNGLNPDKLTVVTWEDNGETKGAVIQFGTLSTTSVVFVPVTTVFNQI